MSSVTRLLPTHAYMLCTETILPLPLLLSLLVKMDSNLATLQNINPLC
jgi:hypothetical protein